MDVALRDVYDGVLGQERAVSQLRSAAQSPVHAYLFVGPSGTGRRAAARGFAAQLLCPDGGCTKCSTCDRVLRDRHPDVVVFEREGASISTGQAREVVRLAATSPLEGQYKVLVLADFHLVDEAAPALLKTIEEPPASAVFVVVAEHVPKALETIASRCALIEFGPVPDQAITDVLIADGVDKARADLIVAAAGGRIDRAKLLASDPSFLQRRELWRSVPQRLDGTGSTVAMLADQLVESLNSVVEPLAARQRDELQEFEERGGGKRKEVEDRHKREQRRVRTDELRFGLANLSEAYRERLITASTALEARRASAAVEVLQDSNEALERNPNEVLLLQSLLLRLGG